MCCAAGSPVNAGQLRAELAGHLERALAQFGFGRLRVLGKKPQGTANLFGEQAQRAFERMADIVVDGFVGQIGRAVVRGKKRCAQTGDNADHRFARRQLANAERMPRAMQFFTRRAQVRDDLFEAPVLGRHVRHKKTAPCAEARYRVMVPRDYRVLRTLAQGSAKCLRAFR